MSAGTGEPVGRVVPGAALGGRVVGLSRRLVAGTRALRGAGGRPGPAAAAARTRQALSLVRRVERREDALPSAPTPRSFLVHGRAMVAEGGAGAGSELVPHSLRDALRDGGTDLARVRARVAADVLALAKFDLGAEAKLRAHYVERGLTLAAQPAARGSSDGIGNAVAAHQVVARHAPGLGPRLRGHGRIGRVPYLVEEWVEGTPALTSVGLAELAPQVVEGLARIHEGHGLVHVPLSAAWPAALGERWADTVATGLVPGPVGARVARLVAADREVRVSWTHGDLVASNVLRTPDGSVVLIDWEHARERPVMLDAAKLHLFSATPDRTLEELLDRLGRPGAPAGAYPVAEDLALAHVQLLSGYARRLAQLDGHARQEVYARQARRQVERLEQVLDRAG